MNIEEYLKDLGYVTLSEEESSLLSNHIHSLNLQKYTIKFKGVPFIVGIFNNYYIYFVENLYQREGWYDMYPHDIPKATPVKINDLVLNTFFDEDVHQDKESILDHLVNLGWKVKVPLKDTISVEFEHEEYYLEFKGLYYAIFTKKSDSINFIHSIGAESKEVGSKKIVDSFIPSVRELLDQKINRLIELREKLP